MPLDGITTRCLSLELDRDLRGSRIDKIYQPDKYDLYFLLRGEKENVRLFLSANPMNPRVHITSSTRENPSLPPGFCMLLRKHLSGARILQIKSPGYERIIEIEAVSTDELGDKKIKRLIIEMMGRYSNIILTNESGIIFDSLLHVDSQMSRVREVMPARLYVYPPMQEKYDPQTALSILKKGELPILKESMSRPLEKAIQESFLGFSPLLSRELCYRSGIDKRTGVQQLSEEELSVLKKESKLLFTQILEDAFAPGTYSSSPEEKPFDFHSLPLQDAGIYHPSKTLSAAIDVVHKERDRRVDFELKKKSLLLLTASALSHAVRKRNIHQMDIDTCKNAATWQKFGQLLLANHYLIPSGAEFFDAVDYESEDTKTVRIPMESRFSVTENAQIYFKRYSKEKKRLSSSEAFLEEDIQAVEYLSTLHQAVENASDDEDILLLRDELTQAGLLETKSKKQLAEEKRQKDLNKKHPGKSKSGNASGRAVRAAAKAAALRAGNKNENKRKSESVAGDFFRKYTTSDHMTILCGRNNLQNDLLTMKTAAPDDMWFHVQKMPGTHVILRCEKKTPSEKSILEAAGIAAFFSRSAAKSALPGIKEDDRFGTLKLPVDYCPVQNVKKPPKSKPGMVIYERYKTMIVEPLDPSLL